MKPYSFFVSFISRSLPTISISISLSAVRSFQAIPQKVTSSQNPFPVTLKETNHVSFMKDFCALIRKLINNNRDFKLISTLDSILTKTDILDSAASVLVIDGLCRLNKLGRAKAFLLDLKKKGKLSDPFLYSLVIQCLVRDGKIKDAESVWNEICVSESSLGIDSFVVYLCKFGEVSEIEWVYKRVLMGGVVLKQQSYIALIGSLCRKNACLLAKDVLQAMEESGFEPDDVTYIGLFQCLCKNGNLSEADLIFRSLVRRGYSMDVCVYGSFIYGLCKKGKLREADKLFRKLIRKDGLENAVSPLKKGRRAIFQLNCQGVVPEIMVYETYFRSLCSVGQVGVAEKLLKEMMRKTIVLEVCVYRSFIKALFRAGRADDAMKFYNVERRKRFVSEGDISVPVLLGFCELGRVDDAQRLFHEIVNGGFFLTASVCNSLLDSYCKAGRLYEAMCLFERMRDGIYSRPDVMTYTIIVDALCACGNVEEALCIFQETLNENVLASATLYKVIIKGLYGCGRLEAAHKCLNEMIESGHLVSYFGWRSLFDYVFVRDDPSLRF